MNEFKYGCIGWLLGLIGILVIVLGGIFFLELLHWVLFIGLLIIALGVVNFCKGAKVI